MSDISAAIRAAVNLRANQRCEYCGLSQVGQEASFHVDHISPRSLGGASTTDNLALACVACSLHKAAKRTATDPELGEQCDLFNPRTQSWSEHFRWKRETLLGLSGTGRATIFALKMNRPIILAIRKEEAIRGRHPHL